MKNPLEQFALENQLNKKQMTTDEMLKALHDQPIRFEREKDELTQLQERWCDLIRNIGFKVVKDHGPDYMCKPDLFDVANEIKAFFTGLKK